MPINMNVSLIVVGVEHLQSHIEEMPYQCRWLGCGNGFPRWHDRNEHEKLHKRRDI
jgi:hypothetical protein